MTEAIACLLMIVGASFMLLGALGVARMPDLYTRMQSTTKAATLGVGCLFAGAAFYFGTLGVAVRAIAAVVFVFLTQPIAAHMISRAGYFMGVPLWEGTRRDELRGRYDPRTHVLESSRAGNASDSARDQPPTDSGGS
jgi:multicomponent Na+:H+ antiporter subunit G